MIVISAAWAVVKFLWALLWGSLVVVWWLLSHIGWLAIVVGVLWTVISIINNPHSRDPDNAPSPLWGVACAVVGACVAYIQSNWV